MSLIRTKNIINSDVACSAKYNPPPSTIVVNYFTFFWWSCNTRACNSYWSRSICIWSSFLSSPLFKSSTPNISFNLFIFPGAFVRLMMNSSSSLMYVYLALNIFDNPRPAPSRNRFYIISQFGLDQYQYSSTKRRLCVCKNYAETHIHNCNKHSYDEKRVMNTNSMDSLHFDTTSVVVLKLASPSNHRR